MGVGATSNTLEKDEDAGSDLKAGTETKATEVKSQDEAKGGIGKKSAQSVSVSGVRIRVWYLVFLVCLSLVIQKQN